jgi:16S rRNA (guanine527-N7)-methyltransferase
MGKPREIDPNGVQAVLGRCGLSISLAIAEQVCVYLELLQKWNARMNLTGRMTSVEVLENLFAESFLAVQLLRTDDSPCLDVGSGAGFPGMAMKIFRPELDMILLEPRQRRAAFLARLKRGLEVQGVEIICRRLEANQLPILKSQPALMVSRGLGNQVEILKAGKYLLIGSRRVLMFTTPKLAATLRKGVEGIRWDEPVLVPWNSNHVLQPGQWLSDH